MPRRTPPVDPSIAERVRTRRELRGWSVRDAADRAGLAHSTWSRIERGELHPDRYLITDLAAALECAVTDVTGQPYVPADHDLEIAHTQVERLWRALMAHPLGEPPSVERKPATALSAEADLVRDLYNRCDYAGALTRLVDLVPALHAASGERVALAAMVPVYGVAMGSLLHLGYPAYAWLAAERCAEAASTLADPVAMAVAACNRGRIAAAGGAYGPARALVTRAADALEGHLDRPAALETLGFTHLTRAHHSIGLRDLATAVDHLVEAEHIAVRTGETRTWDLAFGPANVALWKMSAQLDTGQSNRAIETAGRVNVGGLPPTRQVVFYLDLARGMAGEGRADEGVQLLMTAEHVAPQFTRSATASKVVARSLLPQTRGDVAVQLRGLCERIGVAA